MWLQQTVNAIRANHVDENAPRQTSQRRRAIGGMRRLWSHRVLHGRALISFAFRAPQVALQCFRSNGAKRQSSACGRRCINSRAAIRSLPLTETSRSPRRSYPRARQIPFQTPAAIVRIPLPRNAPETAPGFASPVHQSRKAAGNTFDLAPVSPSSRTSAGTLTATLAPLSQPVRAASLQFFAALLPARPSAVFPWNRSGRSIAARSYPPLSPRAAATVPRSRRPAARRRSSPAVPFAVRLSGPLPP